MSEPFLAEVRLFGFNYAPRGWAFCDGQLLPIAQNTALFSLVGTMYGGDGQTTFALPDLRGRAPMQPGGGPGLTTRVQGENGGTETVALTESQMPRHRHTLKASTATASATTPSADHFLGAPTTEPLYALNANRVPMSARALKTNGRGTAHENMMPFLTLNFCIALQGIYPPRP